MNCYRRTSKQNRALQWDRFSVSEQNSVTPYLRTLLPVLGQKHLIPPGTLVSGIQIRASLQIGVRTREISTRRRISIMLCPGLLWAFVAFFGFSKCGPKHGAQLSLGVKNGTTQVVTDWGIKREERWGSEMLCDSLSLCHKLIQSP